MANFPRRRFRRRPYGTLAMGLVLLVALLVRLGTGPDVPQPGAILSEGQYSLNRVVDGDTIIVEPHTVIRLIGVNTPETVRPNYPVEPFGPQASAFTRQFLAGGTLRLTFDRERQDRHGRHLAYVWVDGRMLNEELLREGLARYEPQYRYSEAMKRRFRQAQQEAKAARRGIWSHSQVWLDRSRTRDGGHSGQLGGATCDRAGPMVKFGLSSGRSSG